MSGSESWALGFKIRVVVVPPPPKSRNHFRIRVVVGFGFRDSGGGVYRWLLLEPPFVQGFEFRVPSFGFWVSEFGRCFRVSGFGFRDAGFGFRDLGGGLGSGIRAVVLTEGFFLNHHSTPIHVHLVSGIRGEDPGCRVRFGWQGSDHASSLAWETNRIWDP